jgi:hypothetical protein
VFQPATWALYEPLLRADFHLFDTYTCRRPPALQPLGCPIAVYWGTRDRRITQPLMQVVPSFPAYRRLLGCALTAQSQVQAPTQLLQSCHRDSLDTRCASPLLCNVIGSVTSSTLVRECQAPLPTLRSVLHLQPVIRLAWQQIMLEDSDHCNKHLPAVLYIPCWTAVQSWLQGMQRTGQIPFRKGIVTRHPVKDILLFYPRLRFTFVAAAQDWKRYATCPAARPCSSRPRARGSSSSGGGHTCGDWEFTVTAIPGAGHMWPLLRDQKAAWLHLVVQDLKSALDRCKYATGA